MIEKLKNPKTRKYIYQVISALIPVLIVFGVAIPGQSELILALAAALLGLGGSTLANANTPRTLEEQEKQVRVDTAELTRVESRHEPEHATDDVDRMPRVR